tara:strand:- start:330 stop:872 length:543 start_codon:yes stop_codon:yes gene_type:complete
MATAAANKFYDKFFDKVNVDETSSCWLWSGSLNKNGYGLFRPTYKTRVLAHRFSYLLVRGPFSLSTCVLHTCDVRNCVNPTHLFLGTRADNIKDMVAKGRHTKGETHAKWNGGKRTPRTAYSKKFYKENKERIDAYQKENYVKTKATRLATCKKYYEENKDAILAKQALRRNLIKEGVVK